MLGKLQMLALVLLGASLLLHCDEREYRDRTQGELGVYHDPGQGPWEEVAPEDLIEVCGLDPDILAEIDAETSFPYAIVRYGRLCHEHYPEGATQRGELANNFSATKTLSAAVVGRAVKMSAYLPRPLSDADFVDEWVSDVSFNPNARLVHVLAMVAQNDDLSFGNRPFVYDSDGSVQINRLSDVVEAVIAQDPDWFGGVATTGEFAERWLFEPLGMRESSWTGESFASTWASSLRDMARLGLLLIHEGVWDRRRLIDADWVEKITHPVFEDSNTGYGYLTPVAASRNYKIPGIDLFVPFPFGTCQPSALWREYPHGFSEALDCNYDGLFPCEQQFDVGAFAAAGFGGQLIVGHRGLDLVIVTKDAGLTAYITAPWDLVRPALVAHDPVYAGDDEAFCEAYAAGDYAPDRIVVAPRSKKLKKPGSKKRKSKKPEGA